MRVIEKPKYVLSDEQQFEIQVKSWLNDSHYWTEGQNGLICCLWCNKIQPIELNNSTLCYLNPEILKITTI
jgi:hypothetical protein